MPKHLPEKCILGADYPVRIESLNSFWLEERQQLLPMNSGEFWVCVYQILNKLERHSEGYEPDCLSDPRVRSSKVALHKRKLTFPGAVRGFVLPLSKAEMYFGRR